MAKVAVAQLGTVYNDTPATIHRIIKYLEKAAEQRVELCLFPEALIGGYPKDSNFGCSIGRRSKEGREAFRQYFENSIEPDGPELREIADVAARYTIDVVVGAIERDGGTLYCTVFFVGSDGTIRGKRRKLLPTASERLVWGFGDGSTLDVVHMRTGCVGAVICWENYMPMLRMTQYSQGVQIYCAPTADDRETWLPTMRHIAMEGRCFVLTTCQVLNRNDLPEDYLDSGNFKANEVMMKGGGAIISPLGEVLAGPTWNNEDLIVADIDFGEITEAKLDFDAVGHYARPDVFQLSINKRENRPVVDSPSLGTLSTIPSSRDAEEYHDL